MNDSSKLPKWVKDSQEHLGNMAPKIESIKKQGQAEIRRGHEKVEVANKFQQEADYLGRVLSQYHEPEYWNDEIITVTGTYLANSISFLDQNIDRLASITYESGELDEAGHVRFVFALPSTDTSGGTAVYLAASIENRFIAIDPAHTTVFAESEPNRLTSRDTLFQELRSALVVFGDKYVTMLEGSEAALDIGTPDSLHQAAHSMRDCFQQLIEYLAPSEVVKTQPWFTPTVGAPGGVSRRSRLKYVLYGSGENVDENIIHQLDVLSDIAKNSLDFCMARAHGHDTTLTKEDVVYAVDQARNELLNVLRLYNRFRRK